MLMSSSVTHPRPMRPVRWPGTARMIPATGQRWPAPSATGRTAG